MEYIKNFPIFIEFYKSTKKAKEKNTNVEKI